MSKLANLLVAVAIASSLTACAEVGDGSDTPSGAETAVGVAVVFDVADQPSYEAYRLALEAHTTADGTAALATPKAIDQMTLGAAQADVCECTDATCTRAWIEEAYGCGVCMTITCGETSVGGCVPCTE